MCTLLTHRALSPLLTTARRATSCNKLYCYQHFIQPTHHQTGVGPPYINIFIQLQLCDGGGSAGDCVITNTIMPPNAPRYVLHFTCDHLVLCMLVHRSLYRSHTQWNLFISLIALPCTTLPTLCSFHSMCVCVCTCRKSTHKHKHPARWYSARQRN